MDHIRTNQPTPFSIDKIGINFGAPRDRLSEEKTLWINYPHDKSPSPELSITINDDVKYRREHSLFYTGEKNWITSSYAINIKDIEIKIANSGKFTVKLYFAECDPKKAKKRIFNIFIQDKKVLSEFNIANSAKCSKGSIIKEFKNITIDKSLKIKLESIASETLISGIEILKTIPNEK